ncbi:ABC transporter permease [Actinopolymorpha singaporensis]
MSVLSGLARLTAVEAKLFLRETGMAVLTIAFPTLLLVVLGLIPALRRPDELFGGMRFVDVFMPSLVVLVLALLGVNTMPSRLAGYREKGILRRLSTTPVHPRNLLAAQLVVNAVVALVAVGLLMLVGYLAFDVPMPRHPLGFAAALLVGGGSMFALGTLAAATAPTTRAVAAIAMPIYFVCMFLGGVFLPRYLLPDLVVTLGRYAPPGVQALQDAWTGGGPQVLQLAIMAAIAAVAAAVAARLFRWE